MIRSADWPNTVVKIIRGLSPEHWFAILTALVALFMLRVMTPISFIQAPIAIGVACVLTLPIGWAIVTGLLPSVTSRSIRAALIALVGYASTTLLGFFLDVIGLHKLYAPICILLLLAWLVHSLRPVVTAHSGVGRIFTEFRTGATRVLANRSLWVVVGISCLSICAVTPLLAPLIKINPQLSVDYSFTDNYYHLIRAYELSFGAPLRVWPDLSGVLPLVYPDFHNFWVGQIMHFSGADARSVFFIYAPILMVLSNVLLMYALGRALTRSPWGGYVAAALPYLAVIPNPYDPNLFFRDNIDTWPIWTAARLQFLEFRSNMAYGAAWQVLGALVLILVTYQLYRDSRTGIGLLALGSLLTAVLLRIRSHYFVIVAPLYGLILLGLLLRRRRPGYLVPLAVLAAVFGLIYLESTMSYYNLGTSHLALLYGPFGRVVFLWLPLLIRPWISRFPSVLQPLGSVAAFELLQMIGFFYGSLLLIGLIQVLRRRWRPQLADWFLVSIVFFTVPAALLVVLEDWPESSGGNWGAQASILIHGAVLVLVVVPLYRILRQLAQRLGLAGLNRTQLGFGLLLVLTAGSYRAASATLHNQTGRAYPVTQAEADTYYWIEHNTPVNSVVATNPDYPVNYRGETVAQTSFLSGITLRPAYLQFVVPFYPLEVQFRQHLLQRLYTTTSLVEARDLIQAATFDYLLVYADLPTALDLKCCLTLVRDGNPKIYQVPARQKVGADGPRPALANAVVPAY